MRGSGRTYYPGGFLANRDDPDAETIFFPHNGVWNGLYLMGYAYEIRGMYWCYNGANILQIDYWGNTPFITSFPAREPCGIRCVKE
jgi:hypothetical protein